jgi:hypothetical protein
MISEGVSGVYRDGGVSRQPGQHTSTNMFVSQNVRTCLWGTRRVKCWWPAWGQAARDSLFDSLPVAETAPERRQVSSTWNSARSFLTALSCIAANQ